MILRVILWIEVKLMMSIPEKLRTISGASSVSSSIDDLLVSKAGLEILIKNPRVKWPLCVFYRDPSKYLSE